MGGAFVLIAGGRCGKGIQHGRDAVGVGSFDPEVLVLEIETKNWVMSCDPKAWHGIGTPGIAWVQTRPAAS
jgi:hypothetical protein